MKKKKGMKKLLAMAAAILLFGSASAMAATTNVNVSASIAGTCQFSATPALAFGALDQTLATDAVATGNLVFWCTKNAAYVLGDETNPAVADGSFSGTLVSGADTMAYTIAYTNSSGSGLGKTSTITSALTGTITNAVYVNAPAGAYADIVTFTLTP
ncbi:MAG: spore coat protein U domain-containing protein [Deltaproteobacteria bacterium]|nr:spore coat protein U domain-containing protein [Deltaproteobacteria bacterium]